MVIKLVNNEEEVKTMSDNNKYRSMAWQLQITILNLIYTLKVINYTIPLAIPNIWLYNTSVKL